MRCDAWPEIARAAAANIVSYRTPCRRSNRFISNTLWLASIGGRTETENLAWACHRCNYYKGPNLTGIEPGTQMVVPLFNPRRAVWNLHFALPGFCLVGLTPIGRTTVSLLQMNAERRIERRAELVKRGLFKI